MFSLHFFVSLNFGVQKHTMGSQFEVLSRFVWKFHAQETRHHWNLTSSFILDSSSSSWHWFEVSCVLNLWSSFFFGIVHFDILYVCQKLPRISLNNLTRSYLIIEISKKNHSQVPYWNTKELEPNQDQSVKNCKKP